MIVSEVLVLTLLIKLGLSALDTINLTASPNTNSTSHYFIYWSARIDHDD